MSSDDAPGGAGSRHGGRARKWLLRLIGVAIFGAIAWRVDWGAVLSVARRLDAPMMVGALGFLVLMLLVRALRWVLLLGMQGRRPPYRWALRVSLIGSYLGLVTPGRLGDLVRAGYLRRDEAMTFGMGLSSVLVDRALDVAMSGAAAVAGVAVLGIRRWPIRTVSVLAGASALAVLMLLYRRALARVAGGFLARVGSFGGDETRNAPGWRASLKHLAIGIRLFARPRIAWPVFLSALAYGALSAHAYALGRSLGLSVTLLQVVFVVGVANLVALMPVSIAGVGTRDGIFVVLFGLFGLRAEASLAFSIMFLVVFAVVVGTWGGWEWLRDPLDGREGHRAGRLAGGREAMIAHSTDPSGAASIPRPVQKMESRPPGLNIPRVPREDGR